MLKLGVLLVASYLCYTEALPPCVCTRNLAPVCGSDGVTYTNECLLNCKKSKENSDLHEVTSSHCANMPAAAEKLCICTMEYRPVCGTDGNTYPNACALDCEKAKSTNLEKKSDGNCPDGREVVLAITVPPVCKTCTRNMKPVCGSDGVSYNNECLLNCAAAEENKVIKVAREGRCDESKVDQQFDEDQCECTRETIPVCGKNGVTYSNKCILNCAGIEQEKRGKC